MNRGRKPIIRRFRCRQCGTVVTVRDIKDKRTDFCCEVCCRKFYKHKKDVGG